MIDNPNLLDSRPARLGYYLPSVRPNFLAKKQEFPDQLANLRTRGAALLSGRAELDHLPSGLVNFLWRD